MPLGLHGDDGATHNLGMGEPRRRRDRAVILGFLLLAPAMVFVMSNGLAYNLHVRVLLPVAEAFVPRSAVLEALIIGVVLVGPVVALAISLRAILRLSLRHEPGTLIGSVHVRLRPGHLAVSLVSLAILGAIAGYVVLENLPCWTGALESC
jgi:hypothetical protein